MGKAAINRAYSAVIFALGLYLVSGSATAVTPELVEREARFENAGVPLAGLVISPADGEDLPALVVIQGSGDSGRDNQWARAFAEAFARAGFAVLLPDKRGVEPSGGDWRTATFDDLAGDAVAGLVHLQSLPGVRDSGGGFLGLSQGGHVAPLAGLKAGDADFVINASGSMVTMEDQVLHELEQAYLEHDLPWKRIEYLQDFARSSFDYIRCGTDEAWRAYIERRQAIAAGPLARAVATWPDSRDDDYWTFWSNVYDYDPLPRWRELVADRDVPALVLYGANDEYENVPVLRSVALMERYLAPDEDFSFRVFEDSGHALFEPGEHRLHGEMIGFATRWAGDRAGSGVDGE